MARQGFGWDRPYFRPPVLSSRPFPSSSSSSSSLSSSSSEPEEGGCPCSCDCDEEVDQSDCSKNTSHSFGGNPDGADDCEGILEVGEGDSGGGNGGGSGGGAHGEGGNTLSTPGSLPEPSSPCPITLRYKHPLEWSASFNPQSGQISVKGPTGSSISFQGSDGHAGASVSGSSRK